MSLVEELDSHHDKIKKLLRLQLSPFSEEFLPVQAVLMGLPNYWQAQVVTALSDDFGIIRITPKRGGELAAGVSSLLVLFHIEDVFDSLGVPAIQSSNVSMNVILESYVDLSARPICHDGEPESILDLQQRIGKEDRSGRIPLLQAIFVCIKDSPDAITNTIKVPKPTPFRNHPGNFSMGTTQFYFNPLLKMKLNLKLLNYFSLLDSQPPYKTKMKEFPTEQDEMKLVEEVRKMDSNNIQRFLYGEFPAHTGPLPADVTNILPKIVDRVPVTLVFLHRRKLKSDSGIIQVKLSPGRSNKLKEPVTVFAYFQLLRYRFFMKKDCFADDLANIMPVHSTENYYANIELAFPGSKVPFVVLDMWNENLRQDLGAHVPISDSLNDNKDFIEDCAKSIATFTSTSLETLIRSNKRESMTRERSKGGVRRSVNEEEERPEQRKRRRGSEDDGREEDSYDMVGRGGEERLQRREEGGRGQGQGHRRPEQFDDFHPEQISSPHNNRFQDDPRGGPGPRDVPRIQPVDISMFNPQTLSEKNLKNAKYYIARSYNIEDVLVSIQTGTWTSNDQGNRKLNHGYRENRSTSGPVFLLFSITGSKHFCGVAEMTSFVDFKARDNIWFSNKNKWRGRFKVRWIYVKDIPNVKMNHIKLENNEDKPIAFSRDGQDVPQEKGEEALRLIHSYEHEKTVLEDTEKMNIVLEKLEGGGNNDQKGTEILPKPVRTNQRVERKLVWNNFLYDHFGQVLKIMDDNYGIAAGFTMYWAGNKRVFEPFQVLFDVFDVFQVRLEFSKQFLNHFYCFFLE